MAFIAACPSQHDKLSRSNEEAISLSKEDVIEIEGIVREAMPNAIFKVEIQNFWGALCIDATPLKNDF